MAWGGRRHRCRGGPRHRGERCVIDGRAGPDRCLDQRRPDQRSRRRGALLDRGGVGCGGRPGQRSRVRGGVGWAGLMEGDTPRGQQPGRYGDDQGSGTDLVDAFAHGCGERGQWCGGTLGRAMSPGDTVGHGLNLSNAYEVSCRVRVGGSHPAARLSQGSRRGFTPRARGFPSKPEGGSPASAMRDREWDLPAVAEFGVRGSTAPAGTMRVTLPRCERYVTVRSHDFRPGFSGLGLVAARSGSAGTVGGRLHGRAAAGRDTRAAGPGR
jgi:hypothetical protein